MAETLSPGELLRVLRDPTRTEQRSLLFGAPSVAVDLTAALPPGAAGATGWDALSELPCVSIGVAETGVAPPAPALAAAVDLVVASAEERALVEQRIAASPLASLLLVQLLRRSLLRGVAEGLLAESLAYSTLQAGPEFAAFRARYSPRECESSDEPPLLVRRDGDALHMRLNRPEKRNAFSAALRDALCEALALVLADESVTRVLLSGAGPSFCSGGDLDEFGTLPDPATAHAIRSTRNAALLLARCAPRVEAHVHGACVGAGAELPAFCRRVIAAPDAFFQLPEVGLGLVPGAGGTVSLPRRIGRQRTAWLALTGRPLSAEDARAFGLVDEIRAGRACY